MTSPAPLQIRKAAVIGAGTMGSQIAALLANMKIPVLLLDQSNSELLPEDQASGRTLHSPQVRNRKVQALLDKTRKLSPPPFFSEEAQSRIQIGNVDDDLDRLSEMDWIVEAVFERLDVKQDIHQKIHRHAASHAMVTTNTSGIPLAEIVRDLPLERKRRFLGSHFFNPPRYMRLLELVSIPETDPELRRSFSDFVEAHLGKEVVTCKDVPGFISNRIGYFALQHGLWLAARENLTIEEVDAWTGPLIGRPKSATFRLADLIGIDVAAQIGKNLCEALPSDDGKAFFEQPAFVLEMLQRGWLGQKTRIGFYQKVKSEGGSSLQALDLQKLDHRLIVPFSSDPLRKISKLPVLENRFRALFEGSSQEEKRIWNHLQAILCYSAQHVLEITDQILNVDGVMRWGFNWEMGPFEIWDAISIKPVSSRLEKEGVPIPPLIEGLLKRGVHSFYQLQNSGRTFFDITSKKYTPISKSKYSLSLKELEQAGKTLKETKDLRLVDLGNQVVCLELNLSQGLIEESHLEWMEQILPEIEQHFSGLVISNEVEHFCKGIHSKNLPQQASDQTEDPRNPFLNRFQKFLVRLHHFAKPVVTAVHGSVLGEGCSLLLASDFVIAHSETYAGFGVSESKIIPCPFACRRILSRWMGNSSDPETVLERIVEASRSILVDPPSTSAESAFASKILLPENTLIIPNRSWTLGKAREKVLELKQSPNPEPASPVWTGSEKERNRLEMELRKWMTQSSFPPNLVGPARKLIEILCAGDSSAIEPTPSS